MFDILFHLHCFLSYFAMSNQLLSKLKHIEWIVPMQSGSTNTLSTECVNTKIIVKIDYVSVFHIDVCFRDNLINIHLFLWT